MALTGMENLGQESGGQDDSAGDYEGGRGGDGDEILGAEVRDLDGMEVVRDEGLGGLLEFGEVERRHWWGGGIVLWKAEQDKMGDGVARLGECSGDEGGEEEEGGKDGEE